MNLSRLQHLKKCLAVVDKARQIRVNHAPNELMVDGDVLVGEFVAKPNDLGSFCD